MVSLIATVLNEQNSLTDWLEGILSQSKLPDEIIIVDGGSKDGTWKMLLEKSRQNNLVKAFQHPGNISVGRNFAITKAQGDIIVVTDAGCVYDSNWFKKISAPILLGESSFVTTGFGPWFKPDDSLLVRLIATTTTPAPKEFKKDWLPSSRSVAFRKEVWQKVGGYPEWIPLCEDVVFDLKVKKIGIVIHYIREALVFWRPRISLVKYFKQLFGYTRSDGHGKLWLHRQLIRYGAYGGALVLVYLALTVRGYVISLLVLTIWAVEYTVKFSRRWLFFSKGKSMTFRIVGFLLLPFIIVLGDLAKMCGWPVGVYERKIGKIKFEA
jgi:glycosyltransferase involved in cell wall biosynthesis